MMRGGTDRPEDSIDGISRRELAVNVYTAFLQTDQDHGLVTVGASGQPSRAANRRMGFALDRLEPAQHDLAAFVEELVDPSLQNPNGLPIPSQIPMIRHVLQGLLPQVVRDRLGWAMANDGDMHPSEAAMFPSLLGSRNPETIAPVDPQRLEAMQAAAQPNAQRFKSHLFLMTGDLQSTDNPESLKTVCKMLAVLSRTDLRRFNDRQLASIAETLADFPRAAGAYVTSPAFVVGFEADRKGVTTERSVDTHTRTPAVERPKVRPITTARKASPGGLGL